MGLEEAGVRGDGGCGDCGAGCLRMGVSAMGENAAMRGEGAGRVVGEGRGCWDGDWWRGLLGGAVDLLWPLPCAGCGGRRASAWLCEECALRVPHIRGPRCACCSLPYAGGYEGFVCQNCRGRRFFFERAVAGVLAKGMVREMVHRLKYRGERWLARPLAEWMVEVCEREAAEGLGRADVIVPVPLHWRREWVRGYNQAELLARELGRRLRLPVSGVLERIRYTESQTHFDRRERMRNPGGAFGLRRGKGVENLGILLVDDVFTTGATLDGCARVLREAGAKWVVAVAAARAV